MDEKKIYLTEEGLNELKKELDFLKLEKRPEIINALKDARALGDLSENAEYDAARSEQASTEARIKEIEKMLENVEIINSVKTDAVALGTKVKLEYVGDDEIDEYSFYVKKFKRPVYDLSKYYKDVYEQTGDNEMIEMSKKCGLYGLEKILYGGTIWRKYLSSTILTN